MGVLVLKLPYLLDCSQPTCGKDTGPGGGGGKLGGSPGGGLLCPGRGSWPIFGGGTCIPGGGIIIGGGGIIDSCWADGMAGKNIHKRIMNTFTAVMVILYTHIYTQTMIHHRKQHTTLHMLTRGHKHTHTQTCIHTLFFTITCQSFFLATVTFDTMRF